MSQLLGIAADTRAHLKHSRYKLTTDSLLETAANSNHEPGAAEMSLTTAEMPPTTATAGRP